MRARPLPQSCSTSTRRFAGSLLAVDDWCCAGIDTPCRAEEWQADDLVVLTRRGAWALESAGTTSLGQPLQAIFWNGATSYRVRHPVAGGDDATVLRLTAAGREALRAEGPPRRRDAQPLFALPARPVDGPAWLRHRVLLARLRRHGGAVDPLQVEQDAFALLRRLHADAPDAPPPLSTARQRRTVAAAQELIAQAFREPLDLAGIARRVACSPFHLARIFRRATGVSPYQAVVRLRLRAALERLFDEPQRIGAIALDAGFASHSHFDDAFRAEFGVAPGSARQLAAAR